MKSADELPTPPAEPTAQAVLDAATALCGDRQKATCWFHHQRLKVLDDLTAEQLVVAGRGTAVLQYLEMLGSEPLG
jgi:hypothetical protein